MLKTWCIQNLWRMLKTWRIQNLWQMVKTWCLEKYWHLQKRWRRGKTRRLPMLAQQEKYAARWRIALLFRLDGGGICNCWLLSGPADGLVLLFADVLNRVHVDSKWRMVLHCPAFMGRLSPVLYRLLVPARNAQNGQIFGAGQIIGVRLKFHCFQLNHSSLYLCL